MAHAPLLAAVGYDGPADEVRLFIILNDYMAHNWLKLRNIPVAGESFKFEIELDDLLLKEILKGLVYHHETDHVQRMYGSRTTNGCLKYLVYYVLCEMI